MKTFIFVYFYLFGDAFGEGGGEARDRRPPNARSSVRLEDDLGDTGGDALTISLQVRFLPLSLVMHGLVLSTIS
jgi:hypothetical protein